MHWLVVRLGGRLSFTMRCAVSPLTLGARTRRSRAAQQRRVAAAQGRDHSDSASGADRRARRSAGAEWLCAVRVRQGLKRALQCRSTAGATGRCKLQRLELLPGNPLDLVRATSLLRSLAQRLWPSRAARRASAADAAAQDRVVASGDDGVGRAGAAASRRAHRRACCRVVRIGACWR